MLADIPCICTFSHRCEHWDDLSILYWSFSVDHSGDTQNSLYLNVSWCELWVCRRFRVYVGIVCMRREIFWCVCIHEPYDQFEKKNIKRKNKLFGRNIRTFSAYPLLQDFPHVSHIKFLCTLMIGLFKWITSLCLRNDSLTLYCLSQPS